MATNQPQLNLPQPTPSLLNTLMNTFAEQAAQTRQDERLCLTLENRQSVRWKELWL